MDVTDNAARIYAQGLERLSVSELLIEEAAAKLRRAESVEALELWLEALACQREGFDLLDAALAHHRAQTRRAEDYDLFSKSAA
ncbi:MAG: hypothetical protein ACJ74W_22230 [Pyrinomonadaceae bacterium]